MAESSQNYCAPKTSHKDLIPETFSCDYWGIKDIRLYYFFSKRIFYTNNNNLHYLQIITFV